MGSMDGQPAVSVQGTLDYGYASAGSSCSPPVPVYTRLHGPASTTGHNFSVS